MTIKQGQYLREYLYHLLNFDPSAGLRAWADAFEAARKAWDRPLCERLLIEAHRGERDFSPRLRGLVLNRHGQWLAQLGEWQDAIRRLEQSRHFFQDAEDTLGQTQTLNELGNVYQAVGDNQRAEAYYRQALPLQRREGDRRQEAITLNNLAVVLGDQGRAKEAFDTLQASLTLLREVGVLSEVGRALLNLGKFSTQMGKVNVVADYYHEALDVLEKAGDFTGMIYAFNGLGNYYKQRGDLKQATDYYTRSLELAQKVSNLQDQEQALGNLGTLYHQRGEWAVAESYYRQAAELCEDLGDAVGAATWWGNLALVLGLQDREAEALPLLERQLTLYRRSNNRSGEGTALLNLAVYYRDVDDLETAERYFQQALEIAQEIRRPHLEARIHAAWGSVHWRRAQFEKAQISFNRALELYRTIDAPRGQLTALYKLAGMHYERENWVIARSFAEEAWEVSQPLDIPYWHGRLLWLLGEIAFEQGDDAGATYLAQAALYARRAEDEQHYQMSLHSLLERVTAASESGEIGRALHLCRSAAEFWDQYPQEMTEAQETLGQVVNILEE